jgi:hypothetical protein
VKFGYDILKQALQIHLQERSFQKDVKGRYSTPGYNFSQSEQLQAFISATIKLESSTTLLVHMFDEQDGEGGKGGKP